MNAETAALLIDLRMQEEVSGTANKATQAVKGLENAAVTSGGRISGGMAKAAAGFSALQGAAGKMGGALSHAGNQLKGLLSGPLGLIGLGAGLFSIAGIIEGSVKKLEDFTLGLEAVQGVTGETAQAAGALLLEFQKFGLSADRTAQIAGFAEKTLGKLSTTMSKGATATKSAALEHLELQKAELQATGASTKHIDALIKEQKARDQLTASHTKAAVGLSKLQALDKQYGLQLVDSKGKVVDFSTELSQLADLYDRNIPASTKAYVASQLFGRGYAALLPVLQQGSKGIREAAADAKALGLQLGDDTVAKMNQFRDQMRTVGEQVSVLQLRIGMALMPTVSRFVDVLSKWMSSGGSDQLVAFFKSGADFAEQFGHAVETTVVPIFGAIADAWNKVPGPLKDLLIGGFAANKTIKFLFGFSPFHLIVDGIESAVAKGFGTAVAGTVLSKAFVQPVFVTNWAMMGGGGATGIAEDIAAAVGGVTVASMTAVVAAAAASTWAFLQTYNGPKANAPGSFTPNVGSAFDNRPVRPSDFGGIDWAGIAKGLGTAAQVNHEDMEAWRGIIKDYGSPGQKGGSQPRMEANRGSKMDALAAAEVAKGVKSAHVSTEQDIEKLRGVIKPAVSSGVKQGIGPDIEKLRGVIHTDTHAVGGDIESMRGRIAAGLSGVKTAVDRKRLGVQNKTHVSTSVKVSISAKSLTSSQTQYSSYSSASFLNNFTGTADPRAGK